MKCLTFIGFLLPFVSIAQQKLDARLEHVTVFLNGAQVSRTTTAALPAGKSEVILR
ncbi:MAG: hypothetical protein RLZZ628_3683, partial [Bacteroidota bacterium]